MKYAKQRRYRQKCQREGRCPRCGKHTQATYHCDACAAYKRANAAARMKRLRPNAIPRNTHPIKNKPRPVKWSFPSIADGGAIE